MCVFLPTEQNVQREVDIRSSSAGEAGSELSFYGRESRLQVPLRRGHHFNGNQPGFLLSDH